jgi:pimeloyl-ACP methyl ester carboxylesterase
MTTSQFLQRPHGRIAYEVTGGGSGEAPLVLAVPGMGDIRSTYRFLVPALVAAGYRVATTDLRGHGDSDTTFESYDDVSTGRDVLALLDVLSPGRPAVLVGSSMGAGAVTWAAAERPDAVAALVLLGPFVRGGRLGRLQRLALDVALLRPWGPAVLSAWQRSLFKAARPADLRAEQARIRASLARPGAWRAVRATTRTSHAPVGERLHEVRAATLVVMGTADPDFPDPRTEAEEVAQALSGTCHLVEGAGHYPHLERPEEVASAVLAHLAGAAERA